MDTFWCELEHFLIPGYRQFFFFLKSLKTGSWQDQNYVWQQNTLTGQIRERVSFQHKKKKANNNNENVYYDDVSMS